MIIDRIDGCCRTCGSTLRVINVADGVLTVKCIECRDTYDVEPDALGDACLKYYRKFRESTLRLTQKKKARA